MNRVLSCLFRAAASWLIMFHGLLALAQNRIVNGDFERGSTLNWKVYNQNGNAYTLGITSDKSKVHGGNYAARITALNGQENFFIFYTEASVADLSAGSILRARVHLKTENLTFLDPKASVTPILAVSDSKGAVISYVYENASLAGTNDYLAEEILLQLPPGAAKASLQLRLTSGIAGGAIYIDDASLDTVADPGALWTDIPLCQVARDAHGTPRLQVGGKPCPPLFLFGNSGSPLIYSEIARAARVGVNLIQVPINMPWAGLSMGRFEQIVRANPNALILPRIHFVIPQYELDRYSGEQVLDHNGQPVAAGVLPSFASDGFIADCKQQLELLIRLIHNSPYKDHVIGYQLGYVQMGEMFYPDIANHFYDFSEVNRLRFTEWLGQRYGAIGKLNAAWHTSLGNFDQAQIPPAAQWEAGDDEHFRSPVAHQAIADFLRYQNDNQVDRMEELAAHIKSLTASRSLVALFYGYQNELIGNGYRRGIGHSGHLALRRLLDSPAFDILCSPVSYFERKAGDPSNMMSIVDSVELAGKLYLQEEDSNTWLVDPTGSPDQSYNTTYATEFDTLNCLRRDFGNVLAHNQATWWCDLWADGRFEADSIWENNRKLVETYRDSLAQEQPTQPQVALIYDEDAYLWLKSDSYNLTYANAFAQRSVFQSIGAQVGYYHIEDLGKIPASARLYVFVNTFHLDAAQRALVEQIKGGGRTLLWLYAPGYISEAGLSLDQMTQVSGFSFEKTASPINPEIQILSAASSITPGLEGQKFGAGDWIAPTFSVASSTAGSVALGQFSANGKTALALKDFGAWQSIFCGAPKLSPVLLRGICRGAGVVLANDGDDMSAADATNSNGRYLFVYARNRAGRRCFQAPGEKIPNGGFEKFVGALPASGYGCWTSPFYGSLATCSVTEAQAHSGANACQTGPFHATANQYAEPLGIRLQLEDGKTYKVSGWVYVDGLSASGANSSHYVFLNFQPRQWTSAARTFKIAEGAKVNLPDKQWRQFAGTYTHRRAAGDFPNEFDIIMQVNGPYSANNIIVDDISVLEADSTPVTVTEVVGGQEIGRNLTGWTADFALNEQKIFKLVLEQKLAANNWTLFH